MKRKAQAAMEYLMTYGWAILIVIIVAAALYALGVFNPATWTGTRSTGFANLGQPMDWQYKTDGSFNIMLKNSLGSPIEIYNVSVSCASGGADIGLNGTYWTSIGAGGTSEYTGDAGSCLLPTAGSSYSLSVDVLYKKIGGTYNATDSGTITGSAS